MNEELRIVTINSFETVSNVMGYRVYQGIWVPKIGETLSTEREPVNPKDKCAICIKKNECIVGRLPLGKTGTFAKTIFYFLRAYKYSICELEITGKPVNLGNGEGMQVPCKLKLTGRSKFENVLLKIPQKLKNKLHLIYCTFLPTFPSVQIYSGRKLLCKQSELRYFKFLICFLWCLVV